MVMLCVYVFMWFHPANSFQGQRGLIHYMRKKNKSLLRTSVHELYSSFEMDSKEEMMLESNQSFDKHFGRPTPY